MHDRTTRYGAQGSGTRWRLPMVVVLSFAVSAMATTIVGAAVGGSATSFVGDAERNSVIGGDGEDSMVGGAGDDFFQGLLGADTLSGEGDDDTLIGDPGLVSFDDVLDGGDGNDALAGAGGADTLRGGPGNDSLGSLDFTRAGGAATTEHGNDQLFGGSGEDLLLAGPGHDVAFGDDGWDHLEGGAGDDFLAPGHGDDQVSGDDGIDTVGYSGVTGPVTINLQSGTATGAAGSDIFTTIENAAGSDGDDTITGDGSANRLDGGQGVDTLNGAGGADILNGDHGADVLRAAATDAGDTLNGGPGNDRVEARNGVVDTVDCGEEESGAVDSDVAVLDAADTVVNCEIVEYPATPPPPTPPTNPTPVDVTAPDTRLTSSPAKVIKTSKKKVKVTFIFASSEVGSSFLCSIDGSAFTPCVTPKKVSLQVGKHVFKVQARDGAGNLDTSPASWTVKIKKSGRG